jgi:hypothetical protein
MSARCAKYQVVRGSRTVQVATCKGSGDGVLVTDGTTSGVDEPCTLFEVLEKVSVNEAKCALVQRAVDCDNVTLRDEVLQVLNATSFDGLASS